MHPHREALGIAAGHGDAGQAGDVQRNRANVDQVHLHRVLRLFAQGKGHYRRGRSDQNVNLLEHPVEVLPDQGPGLLRLYIIRVVVASRQSVGPQHYAPFHLGTKSVLARQLHRPPHVIGVLEGVAVFDAVVSRQVGRAFGRGDDVVAGQGVLGSGQRHGLDRRSQSLQGLYGVQHGLANPFFHSLDEVFLGHAHADCPLLAALGVGGRPGELSGELASVIGRVMVQRRGVSGVVTDDGVQHQSAVGDVLGDRAYLIQ